MEFTFKKSKIMHIRKNRNFSFEMGGYEKVAIKEKAHYHKF